MYNVKSKQIVLEIPKNGSRSLIQAATLGWGKLWLKAQGHSTLIELVEDRLPREVNVRALPPKPTVVVAVIRNPVERLVSQVAHVVRNKASATIDSAMRACWEQSDIVFKPQAMFTQLPDIGDWDMRLFDMEHIDWALTFVAGRPTDVHVNKGSYHNELVDPIMRHELFDPICEERYHHDFALWADAAKRGNDGVR